MTSPGRGAISRLLRRHAKGDAAALDELVPLLYERLRRIARGQIARNRRFDTLNTTALVHEAYLELERDRAVDWQDREHFFAICARAMRRIIVDHARRRSAQKRGGGRPDLPLDDVRLVSEERAEEVAALGEALRQFEAVDPRAARVVECRFFAGLSIEETAAALDVSVRTVTRDWVAARAWLYGRLRHDALERPL